MPPLLPSSFTFQHLHCHGDRLGSVVLVNANSFCHDNLSKAAFSERLAECQPDHGNRGSERVPSAPSPHGSSTTVSQKPYEHLLMKTKKDPSNLTLEYLRNTSNRPLPGSHLAPKPRTLTRYILNPPSTYRPSPPLTRSWIAPTWGQQAAQVQKHWPEQDLLLRTAGQSGRGVCWSS